MRFLSSGLVVLGLIVAAPAHADEREPRVAVGGSAVLWIPQSDADDYTDPSFGVRPQVTFWALPFLGITAAFDWVFVNEEGDGSDDVTYWSIGAGARVTLPKPMRLKPYGEFVIGYHTLDAPLFEESDLGFRFGGGATYALGRSLAASAGVGYSLASLDSDFIELDINAFVIDLGVAGRF